MRSTEYQRGFNEGYREGLRDALRLATGNRTLGGPDSPYKPKGIPGSIYNGR